MKLLCDIPQQKICSPTNAWLLFLAVPMNISECGGAGLWMPSFTDRCINDQRRGFLILCAINPLLSGLLNWRLSQKYLFLMYRSGSWSQVFLLLDKCLWNSTNCLAHLTEQAEESQLSFPVQSACMEHGFGDTALCFRSSSGRGEGASTWISENMQVEGEIWKQTVLG